MHHLWYLTFYMFEAYCNTSFMSQLVISTPGTVQQMNSYLREGLKDLTLWLGPQERNLTF